MKNYNLGFISNEDLLKHVKETVSEYRFSIDLEKFNKNLVDPIKLTFDSKIYKKNIEDLIEGEIIRQIDKSNTNNIGYFHQNIFKYIESNEWHVPKNGFDIINKKKNIYVEMKNKHNTMNSSSSQKTYMKMLSKIEENQDAICMLVEVIAKKSQNIEWEISLDKVKYKKNRIRRVSVDKFYEIVTGEEFAFKNLVSKLPEVINDAILDIPSSKMKNTVVAELKLISPDILKSLYILGFQKYEGFSNFSFK